MLNKWDVVTDEMVQANSSVDNGLTQTQAAEVITHLAFYAGWPNAFSALPVFFVADLPH